MKPRPFLCTALLSLGAAPAFAAEGPQAYALLVGSNRGGPGQAPLLYADDDAARVRDVLVELGGFSREHVRLLQDPGRRDLLAAFDLLQLQLGQDRARGADTKVVFYYSGHARAESLDLGQEELPLSELKARLDGFGAKVTLVVLDACQAGALSNVKGAAPAADFSFNAMSGLNTEGLAVLASSSATELSQESDTLGGSYFTHHLLAGMRGAADTDTDGAVTLDEAYGYAYQRTLVDTAATAVGAQHATLQTDLKGKGAVVLTRPGEASAQLVLTSELAAEVLVYRDDSAAVVAEVHKAAGSPMGLALNPGRYGVLVRQGDALRECSLRLGEGDHTPLDPGACREVAARKDAAKGEATLELPDRRLEHLMIETGLGGGAQRDTPYTERLEDFSFGRNLFWGSVVIMEGSLAWSFDRHLAAVLTVGDIDSDAWSREMYAGEGATYEDDFSWVTWRASLQGRAGLPLLGGWLVPYAQAGLGPAWAVTDWEDLDGTDREVDWGWHVVGAAGLQLMPTVRGWRHVGVYGQMEQSYAPVLKNLMGDRHDSGRFAITVGLRAGF
ncbi:MAG: caspase family protein [Pseudomonadota bacterium]